MLQERARPADSDPEPRSLRERNVALRRQRILDAARALILREGMAGLTMRALAAESELAVKTLYNLWGSRQAILQGLVDQAMDRMDEALEREAPLEDPIARCRAVVTVTVRHLVDDPAVGRSMILAQYAGGEVVEEFDPGRGEYVRERASQMQAVALRAATEQGLVREGFDADVLGRQIYHGYEMAHLHWATGRIDEGEFRARALYGLYVALLGIASDELRPGVEKELRTLDRALRKPRSKRTRRTG